MSVPCPACRTRERGSGKYLCYDCWGELPLPARRALMRRDMRAMLRLQELYDQLRTDRPLGAVTITP